LAKSHTSLKSWYNHPERYCSEKVEARMQTIYLVPHTHYDVAWAFTKEEYLRINEIILEEALNLKAFR